MSKIDINYINKKAIEKNEKPYTLKDLEYQEIKHDGEYLLDDNGNRIGTKGDFNTKMLMDKYFPHNDKIVVIEGGLTRNRTILNSIHYMKNQNCEKDSILVTHDASRIFVSEKLINDSIKYAIEVGAASAVIPSTDVIFESKKHGKLTNIPSRKYLFNAQTPQSFNIDKFLEIYSDLSEDEIDKLDEAMMLFYLRNVDVKLFPGNQDNFKITHPFDITLAETIFKR